MNTISLIHNTQSINTNTSVKQTKEIDSSLLNMAKDALTTLNIGNMQSNQITNILQQNSMEASFVENNASVSVKEAVIALVNKDTISSVELVDLYYDNNGLRSSHDLLFADMAVATLLLNAIKQNVDNNQNAQDLQELTNAVEQFSLTITKENSIELLDTIDTLLEKLATKTNNANQDTFIAMQNFVKAKMENLQQVIILQENLEHIADNGSVTFTYPTLMQDMQQVHNETIFGVGALAFANERFVPVYDTVQTNNLLQNLLLGNESSSSLETLYEKGNDFTKSIIEKFSEKVADEVKTAMQNYSIETMHSALSSVDIFSKRVMLAKDREKVMQELQNKEVELCKEFIANNQGNTEKINNDNAHTIVEILTKTSFSNAVVSFLTNEDMFSALLDLKKSEQLTKEERSLLLRSVLTQATHSGLSLDDMEIMIKEITTNQNIISEFSALSSYIFLQPLLKEEKLLTTFDVTTINFDAMKEAVEVLMQSDKKVENFNNYLGLFINTSFLLYKTEHSLTNEQVKNVPEFLAAFSDTVQDTLKQLIDNHNMNIFNTKFDSNLAKTVLYAASYGLNSRVLYSALRSFDDEAKFDFVTQMMNKGFQQLIGIDSLGNFTKTDLLAHAQKKMQGSLLAQNNARLEDLHLAHALVTGEYESIVSTKEFQALMKAQNITNPEKISGETLATSLNLLQRLLAKEIGELSDFQLAKLGLERSDISSSYIIKQAILNASDSVKNSFEYALLIFTYFGLSNKLDKQSQEEFLKDIGANSTVQGYINLIGLADEEKIKALEGLEITNHLYVDLEKFQTSTVNFIKRNKQGNELKNDLLILTSEKTNANEKIIAKKELLEQLKGTEVQPLTVWADSVVAVKKHSQNNNIRALDSALNKTIRNKNNELLQTVGELYTKDKLFTVNVADKTQVIGTNIESERKLLLSDYDQNLLESSKKVALGLACLEFGYADYFSMLSDFATKQKGFADQETYNSFKPYMENIFTELGLDKSVASSVVDSLVFHSLDLKEKINQQVNGLINKAKEVVNAIPLKSAEGKIQDLVTLYKSSINILEELDSGQAIYVDGKTGLTLEIEPVSAGIDMANIFSLQRTANNEPVIMLGSGFIGEIGAEFEVHEGIGTNVKVDANAMGLLSLTFKFDADAAIFTAKVLSRLADKYDLFYAKNAYVSYGLGAGLSAKAEVNLAKLVNFDYAELGFGVEVGGQGSYYSVRGTKHNEMHFKGAYTVTGEIGLKLSDSVKELAEKPLGTAEAFGMPTENSKTYSYSVEKELIGQTDIFNNQLTALYEEHTLIEDTALGINLFGKKHGLTDEQIQTLKDYAKEHKEDGIKIKIRYEYDVDTNNLQGAITSQIKKTMDNSSRNMQACTVIITQEKNDNEFEKPFEIAGITLGVRQNYEAVKVHEEIV